MDITLMSKFETNSRVVLIVLMGLPLALCATMARAQLPNHQTASGPPAKHATVSVQPKLGNDLIVVQAPEVRAGNLAERYPKGSRLARLDRSGKLVRPITPGFFAAADPHASFDATQILFSGKKTANSPWQVWEMNADGSDPRQLTHCGGDCVKPAYLPRGEFVYTALADKNGKAACSEDPASAVPAGSSVGFGSQLCVSKTDGTAAHAVTFGPGDFEVETVLKNGMVLATARSPLLGTNRGPADRELYTVRSDGSGLSALRCDHQHPAIRRQAQELDNGAVVFVKAPVNDNRAGGELAWIPRGALHNSPLTTPPVLAASPQPAGGDVLLVARASTTSQGASSTLALSTFDTELARFTQTLLQDPKLSAAEAVPVAAHEPPRWYWSTLNPDLKRGYFICLDSHWADGIPQGRLTAKLARVRVLKLDAASGKETGLGEAPIEQDGSFYIAVPPDTPVRFELLDAAGSVVRAQHSWIWARSGEEHGCAGCHEDRALAPENRWPMALRNFDNPTRLDLAKAK